VTFRFSVDTEVHYVDRLPEAGDLVTHRDELWFVASVEADSIGALVICEPRLDTRPRRWKPVEAPDIL
jgi:hypothetical protein